MQFQQNYCITRGPYAMNPASGLIGWVTVLARTCQVQVNIIGNPICDELEVMITSRFPGSMQLFEKQLHRSLHPNYWYLNTW